MSVRVGDDGTSIGLRRRVEERVGPMPSFPQSSCNNGTSAEVFDVSLF